MITKEYFIWYNYVNFIHIQNIYLMPYFFVNDYYEFL